MATRSNIAVQQPDGTFLFVYVHNDGYYEGVGATLLQHYDIEKARALVAHGDISIVGEEIGEKHDFDEPRYDFYGNKTLAEQERIAEVRRWCRFYGRDRDEKGTEPHALPDLAAVLKAFEQEYLYVMKTDGADGYAWFTLFNKTLTPLAEVFDGDYGEDVDED